MLVAAHVDDAVNQQKRIPVRQQPEDFCNVRDAKKFRRSSFNPFDLAAASVQPIPLLHTF